MNLASKQVLWKQALTSFKQIFLIFWLIFLLFRCFLFNSNPWFEENRVCRFKHIVKVDLLLSVLIFTHLLNLLLIIIRLFASTLFYRLRLHKVWSPKNRSLIIIFLCKLFLVWLLLVIVLLLFLVLFLFTFQLKERL